MFGGVERGVEMLTKSACFPRANQLRRQEVQHKQILETTMTEDTSFFQATNHIFSIRGNSLKTLVYQFKATC